jgi:hypothetical protein
MKKRRKFQGTGWSREESDVPNARQSDEMNERLRKANEEGERQAVEDFKRGRPLRPTL